MKKPISICLALIIVLSSFCVSAAPSKVLKKVYLEPIVVRVEEYGAIANDPKDDSIAIISAINDAIKAGEGSIVYFSKGKYIVDSPYNASMNGIYALKFSNAKGLTIIGNETELIFTDNLVGAFSWQQCENLSISGITIDYKTPPFTQGKVVSVNTQNASFEYKPDAGYTHIDDPRLKNDPNINKAVWGTVRNIKNPLLMKETVLSDSIFLSSWDKMPNGNYKMVLSDTSKKFVDFIKKDDPFVLVGAVPNNHALTFRDVKNVKINNFNIYTSPAIAVAGTFVDGIILDNLNVKIKPNSGRLLSTKADGVHLNSSRIGPIIQNCSFEGMGDDAVNFYNKPNYIKEVISDKVINVQAIVPMQLGDTIEILDKKTGFIKGVSKVVGLKEVSASISQVTLEKEFSGMVAGTGWDDADNIFNYNACGAGFVIKNSHFKGNRRYGLILRSRGGIIENNIFENQSSVAITLENDVFWNEGPMSANIEIKNNIFRGVGYLDEKPAINIEGFGKTGKSISRGHQNISIEGNQLEKLSGSAISVVSAENISIKNNSIDASDSKNGNNAIYGIYTYNTDGITIDTIKLDDKRKNLEAGIYFGDKVTNVNIKNIDFNIDNKIPTAKYFNGSIIQNNIKISALPHISNNKELIFNVDIENLSKNKINLQMINLEIDNKSQQFNYGESIDLEASKKMEYKISDIDFYKQQPFTLKIKYDDLEPILFTGDVKIAPIEKLNENPGKIVFQNFIPLNDYSFLGEQDLSGTMQLMWDADNLYLNVDVKDDVHSQEFSNDGIWKGDSIQFGISKSAFEGTIEYQEYGLSLTNEGAQVYRYTAPAGLNKGIVENKYLRVDRDDVNKITTYRLSLPWEEIKPISTDDETIKFSIIVNDNDGAGRKGWMEIGSGIGKGKDPTQFYTYQFLK